MSDRMEFGRLLIDILGHKVFVDDEEVELTASEFKLLVTLANSPGRVFTRMDLVEKVLGYDFEGYERTIDSHMKNLRAKIGDDSRHPTWLYTVHGVGYRFELPANTSK
jgi:DNA-binding response OmpR family regulator